MGWGKLFLAGVNEHHCTVSMVLCGGIYLPLCWHVHLHMCLYFPASFVDLSLVYASLKIQSEWCAGRPSRDCCVVAWPLLAVMRWDGSYQELPALSLAATSKNSAQCGLDVRVHCEFEHIMCWVQWFSRAGGVL